MFGISLNKPRFPSSPQPPWLPKGMRVYAIGDIHGRADLLKRMQAMIRRDAAAARATRNMVVYLGDYIDRGPFVRDSIDAVLNGLDENIETICLRGNHEQLLLSFLDDPSILPMWLDFGGLWTMMSYGVHPGNIRISEQRAIDLREELLLKMPAEHLRFFRDLPLQIRLGSYFFVHAGLRPKRAIEMQRPDDLLWIREEFLREDHGLDITVVHGHTIEQQPVIRQQRIGIDTGAYATGTLTCAVLEADRIRFLGTGVDV